jgi:anti-anti-sigma factor
MAEVKIETRAGTREGMRILRLSGPFTLEGVYAFQSAAEILNDPVIIIDLTEVPYMDSAARGALISLHRSSASHQRRFAIVGASERILTMFRVARVDDILLTFRTVEEAERKLGFKAAANEGHAD